MDQPEPTQAGTPPPPTQDAESAESDRVLLVQRDGAVETLVLNRPQARNALSWDLIRQLRQAVASAAVDDSVGAIVLTGAGEKAFCAGADLTGMRADASVLEVHQARGELARLFEDLYQCGKPTIAKVRGFCLAGGFGLAMACDLVYATDDAVFGTPEINVGLWPYMITVPLIRSMPPKKALELMMSGRRIDAAEADRLGCLTRVVTAASLDDEVGATAAELASKSRSVMSLGRSSFYEVWDRSVSESLRALHPQLSLATQLEDAAEGITAFLERRAPQWTNR